MQTTWISPLVHRIQNLVFSSGHEKTGKQDCRNRADTCSHVLLFSQLLIIFNIVYMCLATLGGFLFRFFLNQTVISPTSVGKGLNRWTACCMKCSSLLLVLNLVLSLFLLMLLSSSVSANSLSHVAPKSS